MSRIAAISTLPGCTGCIWWEPSFETCAKSNLAASRIYSAPSDRTTGIIADQTVAWNGYLSQRAYPSHLRCIRLQDPAPGKTLAFFTNQFTPPASTIHSALLELRTQCVRS